MNNAAGNFISRTEDLTPKGFDAIANIVFRGAFYVTQDIGKRWIAEGKKGSICSIVVTWVWDGGPFTVPSAMSKAGIDIMTKSLAIEWGRYGIRLQHHRARTFPNEGRVGSVCHRRRCGHRWRGARARTIPSSIRMAASGRCTNSAILRFC